MGKNMSQSLCTITQESALLKTDSENCTKWSYNKLRKSQIITKWREGGQEASSNSISLHPITPPVEDHHVSLPHWKTGTGHRIGVNFQMHFIRILASPVPWKPRKEHPKEAVTTVTKDNKMSSPQRPETTYPLYLGLRIISDLLTRVNKQLLVHMFKAALWKLTSFYFSG